MLFQILKKAPMQIPKTSRLRPISRRWNLMERYQNRKKEDMFKKELEQILSKPVYTLRDFNEKVRLGIEMALAD